MTRHGKAIGTFLGTLLLAAGLTLGIGAPPALGGDVDVPTGGATFTLPDGERARIEFRVDIDDPLVPPETTEVCNQGTVSGTNITGSPVLTDDPALAAVDDPTCTTIDTVSDVSLNFSATGKAGPASVVDGNAIQYTITVENDGPDTATNVVVTDTVPSDLTSISTNGCDNDGGGASVSGFVVTCELPDLAKDGTDSFTINATVNVGGVGVLNNTAAVNADNDFGGPFNSNTVVTNVVVTLPLTVTVDGSGGGTVTAPAGPDPTMGGTGINCTKIGGDCTENYNPAVVVPLAATADAGSFFNGWTTCDNAMNGTCEETMDGTDSVTATFDDLPTLTVDKAGTGTGTVNINPSAGGGGAVDCTLDGGVDTDCEQDYDVDTAVALMATADAGSAFTGWMNCDSAVTNVCTQTVDGDETVTATFIRQFTLTVEVPGIMGTGDGRVTSLPEIDCGTTGTMDCTEDYDTGTVVGLLAVADAGSLFSGWTGANCDVSGGGTNPNCQITMDADKTVTGNFLTPEEGLNMLIAQVEALGLSRGNQKSLTKKLKNAIKALNKNKDADAADKIEDFKNEIMALAGKKFMPASLADPLLAKATAIIDAILP